ALLPVVPFHDASSALAQSVTVDRGTLAAAGARIYSSLGHFIAWPASTASIRHYPHSMRGAEGAGEILRRLAPRGQPGASAWGSGRGGSAGAGLRWPQLPQVPAFCSASAYRWPWQLSCR